MKLSIITINFNNKEGLKRTIESVRTQTFRDFEHIVIDGASTDGSLEVIKQYADGFSYWVSEKDTGIYNAMNKGAQFATGEYLLFLNSGDELYDDNVLLNVYNQNPVEDLVSGVCLEYNDKISIMKTPPHIVSLYTFIGGSLSHPSTFIKKELFLKVGGYKEEYRIISDWCFFVDSTLKYNCSYKPLPYTITKFNLYGISSTQPTLEEQKASEYLNTHFGRVMLDYLPLKDEALTNTMYFIADKKGFIKKLLLIPFKFINRVLKLRNRIGKRIGVHKIL